MNYNIANDAMPSAFITKRKSRIKIYQETNVHLNDGDNFEIELYNPTTSPILAKIKLNGEYISSNGVIIKPGQRVFLERFLDSNNKFVFNTYDVQNNRQNKDAIAFNGDVSVEFYAKLQPNPTHLYLGNAFPSTLTNTSVPYSANYPIGTNISYTTNTNSFSTYTSSSVSTENSYNNIKLALKAKKNIETGTIEKGAKSDQTFISSYDNFQHYSFHKMNYKILPSGVKAVYSSDLKQYCVECGKKQKKENKFCPACGTKI